ncbi:desulfoferrodoxin [Candidatus Woesearchaeota archaeon]|nr:desulfoferrodoxin [Candidatus Woesearchaeota archaeon]
MSQIDRIYRCEICGNVVSVLEAGKGELVCCGKPMSLMEEKTSADEGKEKHVPLVGIDGSNVLVKVGSIPHPMEEKHYIKLIQLVKDGKVIAGKRLNPGEKPEAEFCLGTDAEGVKARILCNVHGVWVS